MLNKVLSFFNHNLKPSGTADNTGLERMETDKLKKSGKPGNREITERAEKDFKNMTKDKKIRKIKEVFANIPRLETRRLILRRIKENDYMDIYEYSSDSEVTKYLTWYPHTSLKETKDYTNYLQKRYDSGKFFDWGLVCKDDGKFIGTCGFTSINLNKNTCEVGYVLSKKYWGKELIPESLDCVMEFAFNYFGFDKVEARYLDGNSNSRRVMQKAGMVLEKIDYNILHVKGEYKTVYTYYITKDMYNFRKSQKINTNGVSGVYNIGSISNISNITGINSIKYGKDGS